MAEPIEPTTALRGVLRLNEPMAKHVSWRAGGAAARVYSPTDSADLAAFLATLPPGAGVLRRARKQSAGARRRFPRTVVLMHNPAARCAPRAT